MMTSFNISFFAFSSSLFLATGFYSFSFVFNFPVLNCYFYSFESIFASINAFLRVLSLSFFFLLSSSLLLFVQFFFSQKQFYFSFNTCKHTHTRMHIGEYSECSQRLMIWKLDENKRKKRDKRKNAKANNNIPKIVVTSNERVSAAGPTIGGGSGLNLPPPAPPSSTLDVGMKKSSRKKMYLCHVIRSITTSS